MAVRPEDLLRYERRLREQGFSCIAGADEAGRGALAGPMFAAAVILPSEFDPEGIADSKVLTRRQREACYERIVAEAAAIAVCRVTPAGIDRRGLHRSNLSLLRRVVRSLPIEPDYVLTDGWPIRRLPMPALSIKKGDAVAACVAAASIVAKVERDRTMERYHRRYPEFGFDHNRGYGTAEHWAVLVRRGPTAIHRLSFRGVANPRPLGAALGRPAEHPAAGAVAQRERVASPVAGGASGLRGMMGP
jgi:ribonuclease HII